MDRRQRCGKRPQVGRIVEHRDAELLNQWSQRSCSAKSATMLQVGIFPSNDRTYVQRSFWIQNGVARARFQSVITGGGPDQNMGIKQKGQISARNVVPGRPGRPLTLRD
jgi:hypothetical protein